MEISHFSLSMITRKHLYGTGENWTWVQLIHTILWKLEFVNLPHMWLTILTMAEQTLKNQREVSSWHIDEAYNVEFGVFWGEGSATYTKYSLAIVPFQWICQIPLALSSSLWAFKGFILNVRFSTGSCDVLWIADVIIPRGAFQELSILLHRQQQLLIYLPRNTK